MIFGVIYWMFPIITRERPRGNETFGWVSCVMLHAGLIVRVASEPLYSTQRRPKERYALVAYLLLNADIWLVVPATALRAGREVLLAGRIAELAAVLFFALHAWRRCVSRESS